MTTRKSFRNTRTAALALGFVLIGVSATADQVIPDDLIVQGSTCTGFDCVNNENFGIDTLILKENNTRLLFLDTSTLSGFPTNDWRLIANSDLNGGGNFFAIQDATASRQLFTVTAGAAANAIFVDSSSRVGLRTATPALDLHISTGNTPAHRLEQTNSSGFPAQTWDIAGNEANFFIRDLTGGSRLPFRIRPGAPTSSVDINASGNVGMGTASPSQKLHLEGTSGILARIVAPSVDMYVGQNGALTFGVAANGMAMVAQDATKAFPLGLGTVGSQPVIFGTSNSERVRIAATGEFGIGTNAPAAQLHTTATVRFAGVPNCSAGLRTSATGDLSCIPSARQFKTIAGELEPHVALANVMALRPQVGSYKDTPEVPEHWLIAEETAAVDPALVGLADGKPYTVKTQNVVADLIAVVQQQQRRIEALEQRLAQR